MDLEEEIKYPEGEVGGKSEGPNHYTASSLKTLVEQLTCVEVCEPGKGDKVPRRGHKVGKFEGPDHLP